MKKILFATVILLTSCGAFDRDYKFYFYNHSSRDKDSMHIYVIDAEQILLPNDYLSEDLIEKIEPEMILTRMTVTHRDFDNKRVDYWP